MSPRNLSMKMILLSLTAAWGLLLPACSWAPAAHTAKVDPVPTTLLTSEEPLFASAVSYRLGAGDVLGQRLFTHAVALARANPETGWQYADATSRAIFPDFHATAPATDTATVGVDTDNAPLLEEMLLESQGVW